MELLPIELIEKISLYYPELCFSIMLVFKIKNFYSEIGQKNLKKHFTSIIKTEHFTKFILPSKKKHRDDDLPAVIFINGQREWWRDGKRHRDNDNPAIIYKHGDKEW